VGAAASCYCLRRCCLQGGTLDRDMYCWVEHGSLTGTSDQAGGWVTTGRGSVSEWEQCRCACALRSCQYICWHYTLCGADRSAHGEGTPAGGYVLVQQHMCARVWDTGGGLWVRIRRTVVSLQGCSWCSMCPSKSCARVICLRLARCCAVQASPWCPCSHACPTLELVKPWCTCI
jgi:hypothetical protein